METRTRPPETLETARLVARLPRVDDAPAAFAAYASDPAVTRYLAWRTYEAVEPLAGFLRSTLEAWAAGQGHFAWMLCIRGTDSPVGSIGCEIENGKAMFGYALSRRFWGQGLMSEALSALVIWPWPSRPSSAPGPIAMSRIQPRCG